MLQTFTMQIQQYREQNAVVMGMGGNTSEPLSSPSAQGSKMTSWGYLCIRGWGAELDLKRSLQSALTPTAPLQAPIQPTAGSAYCSLSVEEHPPVSGPCSQSPGCWKVNSIRMCEVRETVIKVYV